MARRDVCACAVLAACLLGTGRGDIHTTSTKSLIGPYPNDCQVQLPAMYIKDAQCNAYIGPKDIDVCHSLVSSVTVLAKDKLPPDIKIELYLARRPQWGVKIYRTTADCAGDANVTVTVTCHN